MDLMPDRKHDDGADKSDEKGDETTDHQHSEQNWRIHQRDGFDAEHPLPDTGKYHPGKHHAERAKHALVADLQLRLERCRY